MKKLVLIGLLSTFGFSASAGTLLEVSRVDGFTPNPSTQTINVDQNTGVVTSVTTTEHGNAPITTTTVLAQLSKAGLKNLKTKIVAATDANGTLEDQQPDQPKCSDAPTFEINVSKGSGLVTVFKSYSCHTFKFKDGLADDVVAIAEGFFELR